MDPFTLHVRATEPDVVPFQKKFWKSDTISEVLDLVKAHIGHQGVWLSYMDKKLDTKSLIESICDDDLVEIKINIVDPKPGAKKGKRPE